VLPPVPTGLGGIPCQISVVNQVITTIYNSIMILVIGFIELLQLVTASKDYALTVLHTSQITMGHTRSSPSVTIFTSHCLVVASNCGRSPSSGFPNCPRPHLPASYHNSSQQLNLSSYLTDWLIDCNS
jgi:hypothetical protein